MPCIAALNCAGMAPKPKPERLDAARAKAQREAAQAREIASDLRKKVSSSGDVAAAAATQAAAGAQAAKTWIEAEAAARAATAEADRARQAGGLVDARPYDVKGQSVLEFINTQPELGYAMGKISTSKNPLAPDKVPPPYAAHVNHVGGSPCAPIPLSLVLDDAARQVVSAWNSQSYRTILKGPGSDVNNDYGCHYGATGHRLPDPATVEGFFAEGSGLFAPYTAEYKMRVARRSDQYAQTLAPLGATAPITVDTLKYLQLAYAWFLQEYLIKCLGSRERLSAIMEERQSELARFEENFLTTLLRMLGSEAPKIVLATEATPELLEYISEDLRDSGGRPLYRVYQSPAIDRIRGASTSAVLIRNSTVEGHVSEKDLYRHIFAQVRAELVEASGKPMKALPTDCNWAMQVPLQLVLASGSIATARALIIPLHLKSSGEQCVAALEAARRYVRPLLDTNKVDVVIFGGDLNKTAGVASATNASIEALRADMASAGHSMVYTGVDNLTTHKCRNVTFQVKKRRAPDASTKISVFAIVRSGLGLTVAVTRDDVLIDTPYVGTMPMLPRLSSTTAWGDHGAAFLELTFADGAAKHPKRGLEGAVQAETKRANGGGGGAGGGGGGAGGGI